MLSSLEKQKGRIKKPKRVGRGIGSGKGGHTTGKGQKGQKSRGVGKFSPWFEGGQLPLVKRLPQVGGFRNPTQKFYTVLNLDYFDKFKDGDKITRKLLEEKGLRNIKKSGIKILGDGDITKKLHFEGFLYSKSAIKKISSAAGSAK